MGDAGVYYTDNGWVRYGFAIENAIRAAYNGKKSTLSLGRIRSEKYPRGTEYMIDFKSMEQVNVDTGYRRKIKIIEAARPYLAAAISHDVEKHLRLLCEETFLRKVIRKMHPSIKEVRSNKFLANKPEIYDKFLQALALAVTTNKEVLAEISSAVQHADATKLKSLEFVFHGTPRENLQSILKNGLDANRIVRTNRFWVAKAPRVSLDYCKAGSSARQATMLLFLELKGHDETEYDFIGKKSLPNTKLFVLLPEIDYPANNN